MPYLLVSTTIRLENGPTIIGDSDINPDLAADLGAKKVTYPGHTFSHYETPDPPRIVLDKLDKMGYKLISTTGMGQTCVFTMYKS